jgi:hypothetical protein
MNAPGLDPVLRASDFGRPDLDIAGELETFDSKHASGGGFDRGSRLLRACLSDVHIITIEVQSLANVGHRAISFPFSSRESLIAGWLYQL